MKRCRRLPWLTYLLTVVVAIGLKAHYSRATVSDLSWILAPTAGLVGWVVKQPLRVDPDLGWLPPDGSFVIAPACAGVNFLILVFGLCTLGFAHRVRSARQRGAGLLLVMAAAYLLTIAVNTVRIVIAVGLYQADVYAGWLTPERAHRVAGTVVYLAGLWGAWLTLERLCARGRRDLASSVRLPSGILAGAYIGMTVVLPLANGAWGHYGARFCEHAITVSLVVLSTIPLHSCIRWATSEPVPHAPAGSAGGCGTRGGCHEQADDPGGRRRAGDC